MSVRKERISEAIRRVVCEKIMRSRAIVPGALVTINKVSVSPDYSHAKIFYSIYGNQVDESEASSLMRSQAKDFRHFVAKKLNLKKTPRLEFCLDKNTEHAFKINEILKDDPPSND